MRRRYKTTLAVIALQLFAALACAPDAAASGYAASGLRTSGASSVQRRRRARRLRLADALSPGVWGGEHMGFEVTEGGARMDFDCAHGTVEGRIFVDRAGRFSVEGTYYQEHGGPVREEEEARGERVRLTGRVGGSLMRLTVTRGNTQLGTYTLTRDGAARVFKCR
jgi:hypothetical protein